MSDKVLRLASWGRNNASAPSPPAYRTIPGVESAACCATTLERAEAGARRMEIPQPIRRDEMIRERARRRLHLHNKHAHYRNTLDALTAARTVV